MQNHETFLHRYKQNNKLNIRLISPAFGHLSPEIVGVFGPTHRKSHYFFIFMIGGLTRHGVDLHQFDITNKTSHQKMCN